MGIKVWYDEEAKSLMSRMTCPDGETVEGALFVAGVPNLNGDAYSEECLRNMAKVGESSDWGTPLFLEAYKRVHVRKTLNTLYTKLRGCDLLSSEEKDMYTEAIGYLYDRPTLMNKDG